MRGVFLKLLTHVCCGPCFLIPYETYKREKIEVTAFYFNPNIHPFSEYERRLAVARGYCADNGVNFIEESYNETDYFREIFKKEDKPDRCRRCFGLRLGRTAAAAKKMGCDVFSTTLLVSPYQLHDDLKKAGEDIAVETGIEFFYRDFRAGYSLSVAESRRLGMYRQKYCGCVFSEKERILERREK